MFLKHGETRVLFLRFENPSLLDKKGDEVNIISPKTFPVNLALVDNVETRSQ